MRKISEYRKRKNCGKNDKKSWKKAIIAFKWFWGEKNKKKNECRYKIAYGQRNNNIANAKAAPLVVKGNTLVTK